MIDSQERARLTWHCRRGMLELDLILQKFLKEGLEQLNAQEIKSFDLLLETIDPQLFAWLMGHEVPQDEELAKIVAIIRNNN